MRIALDVLRRSIDLPGSPEEIRLLLDEQGLEVKRVEHDGTDTVFDLEILANRGDHYCYEGVARELDGRLGTGVTRPQTAPLEVRASPWELRCDTELCLVYTATLLERGKRPPRPLAPEALRVLEVAGSKSLGGPIDATNVANLELGQPTHAFDADKIEGPVAIRRSRAGETALPLFAEARVELDEGTLVIADDRKILAIAGVIGCEESKTTADTTRLLLESATFDPVAVRQASRALGTHTDSSARFERGGDPARPLLGAGRVVHLLEQAGWKRVGATGQVGSWSDPGRVIHLDPGAASAFLGVELSAPEVAARLARYGFDVSPDESGLAVEVPSWRLWDVESVADLHEELAKSVGYENTPVRLPRVGLGAQPSSAELRRDRAEEVLLGHGFYEVFTDGFYGRRVIEQLGLGPQHPLFAHVQVQNALERGYSLLKNNALHQAVEAVAVNERRRTLEGRMYEWTRTFHPRTPLPDPPDRNAPVCDERELLWLVTFAERTPERWSPSQRASTGVWFLEGLVHELAVELDLPLTVGAFVEDHPLAEQLHPGRRASIRLAGTPVGVLAEVHPAVARRYKLKTVRPCYLEIDRAALLARGHRPAYVEPPAIQPIVRSVAFTVPRGLQAGAVVDALQGAGPTWLDGVRVTDVFVLEDGGSGPTRSVTFELTYANPDNQRTADEVNEATEALVDAVRQRFGDRGVTQR